MEVAMKYLVVFHGGDCNSIEADGHEICRGGVLRLYRYVPIKGLWGETRMRHLVKAYKVWFTVEPEE